MDDEISPLEEIWEDLLSRQPERARQAFTGLSEAERLAVLEHLRRMVKETGWHAEQRESAWLALKALNE
jgi:truncated hemoglobin YjbI